MADAIDNGFLLQADAEAMHDAAATAWPDPDSLRAGDISTLGGRPARSAVPGACGKSLALCLIV